MEKVEFGDYSALLSTYLFDNENHFLVWVGLLGNRSSANGLIKRARDKANGGSLKDESTFAFTVGLGEGQTTKCKLENPVEYFIPPPLPIATPDELMWLSPKRRPQLYEGRVIAYAATREAGQSECYVPVFEKILPADSATQTAQQIWLDYLTHVEKEADVDYEAPLWCTDLYNLYIFISNRVRVPIDPSWMPWILKTFENKRYWNMGQSAKVIEYLHAYVCPAYKAAEDAAGLPIIEHGAYRIQCDNARDFWRSELIKNPNRFEGIEFTEIVEDEPGPEPVDDEGVVRGESGVVFS